MSTNELRAADNLRRQLSRERSQLQNLEHKYDALKFDCDQLRQLLAEVKRKLPNSVKQTTPTNCFRACVATVLGLPIKDVPLACDGATWDWDAFQSWLATRGLQAIEIAFANGGTIYPVSSPVPCIVSGPSPRECVTGMHAVVGEFVGIEGFNLLHDPHPANTWIDGEPTHATFFVRLANVNEPARWHDKPTCGGLWYFPVRNAAKIVLSDETDWSINAEPCFGPIPSRTRL